MFLQLYVFLILYYFSFWSYWMHFSSAFFSLLSIHTGITSSAIWLKIFAIVAGIKKYKSLIEKNKKNYDKVVLLVNSKLNSIEIKISKASID